MPLANGDLFAGYQILRPIGFGGMGEVYLVSHPRLPRHDALKILPAAMSADPEFRARFNREAELVASLYNPHIVGIHDRGEFNGQLWISMDFIDGPDAGRLLRERYPNGMPPGDVAEIATAVGDALDYAHARGLLHRDVKPPNILLTNPERGRRRIVLADFGIARDAAETHGLTETNMAVGTVNYASPEQLTGSRIDGRADQYGLAATAYHLLTGSPMFGNSNPAVVIGRHLNAPPPRLADFRPALAPLDPVLDKALAKNPQDRFLSCTDFATALQRAVDGSRPLPPLVPPPGPPPGPPARPPAVMPVPPRQQHTAMLPADLGAQAMDEPVSAIPGPSRWPWALAGVALAMLVGALVFALWPRSEPASTFPATTSTSRQASTSAATTTTTSPTAAPVTFESMREAVTGFYGQLPTDAAAAWDRLDINYQQRNGRADYLDFWSTIQTVSVLSVTPRDANSVVATIRYVLKDGRVDTESRWLSVVPRNGELLIYDSERIGPA
jgi:serine/threonine-protein kinase